MQFTKKSDILPGTQTDHSMVFLELQFDLAVRGPGYWKFNTSLLNDAAYIDRINGVLDVQMNQQYKDKKTTWEMVKLSMRGSTIQYVSRKKKAKNNELHALQHKLKQKEDKLINIPASLAQSELHHINLIQQDIKEILTERAKGSVMRARSKFEYSAERPSKYFLNLEKRNFCRKTIYRLELDNGTIISDPKEILQAEKEFYEKLYTSSIEPDLEYVQNTDVPQISKEMYDLLESDITLDEIEKAVFALPNGKAPSTDGIPIEFYKAFWNKIRYLIKDLFDEISLTSKFHISARQGIISLLEKPGKNFLRLKSWRPLTLLNSNYKIFSKVLVTRLHMVLQTVIHSTQTGFLKGRHLTENIMKLMNIIEHCDRTRESVVVISVDFEKAFDKLEFGAAVASLKTFGIGPKFIHLIKILYNGNNCAVLNNGFWSDWIYPTRGTKQGDPISPLIFTATAEILGIKLRTNVKIAGIEVNGETLLNAQYADDTWLALEPTSENIDNALEELQNFETYSGLTINFEKSTAFVLGPLRGADAKFYTVKQLFWSDGPVKILGIHVHPDPEILYNENFKSSLLKIKEILSMWNNRSLSFQGRIVVVNSLISSLLVHKFLALPTPKQEFFSEYKAIISHFIRNAKTPRIRYAKLIQNYQYGGLKLIDLYAKNISLKASWILSDREGHGHKAVLYKSHFPSTKAFTKTFLLERHHCIHRLINHVYTKGQALCYSLPHDMVAARIKH